MSAWVGLQQIIEPGVKHVQEIRQRGEVASKELLLAQLLACFDADSINPDEIRRHLTAARRNGWDWAALYEEAVRIHQTVCPDRAGSIPPLQEVTPLE
jgi:hypothetical protein